MENSSVIIYLKNQKSPAYGKWVAVNLVETLQICNLCDLNKKFLFPQFD